MQKHLIDLDNLSISELMEIIDMAGRISKNPTHYSRACKGKIMATLFYEASTRTQMSFQAAMLRLGGSIIGFDNTVGTSVSKGESLKDTIRVISGYSDVIVMRNPGEGAAFAASMFSKVPVVNAGDGGHLHPTQTLTDIVTLDNVKGTLDNLKIGLCGDLLNGRTVHSLIKTMTRFKGNSFVLISTPELTVPAYIKRIMEESGCDYREETSLSKAIGELDVLYMTRIQRERFSTQEDYQNQKGVYILDDEKLSIAKPDLCVMHPLPRVDEITTGVDDDARAKYFEQAEYGMYARMALIIMMLKDENREVPKTLKSHGDAVCSNLRCITVSEKYLPNIYMKAGGNIVCGYCEHIIKE